MKRKFIFIIIIILVLPFILLAEEEQMDLALDEAIALALRDSRDILLKAEDVKKAKSKIAEAYAGLFPALSFTGNWSNTRGFYSKDISSTTTQATLKQYLYKGGRTINTIEYNEYKLAVAQAILDKTKLEAILNVKKAFYTLLLAKEFANLNKAILENSKRHIDFIQERYKEGQASESEVLGIKTSLSNVEEAYESSLNQIDASLSLLNNLLYLDKEVKIKPIGEFNYQAQELAYDEGFLKAMQNRPEIRQYEAQVKADKEATEIAKADSRPSIYASWDYYSRSHVSATAGRNWNDYNVLGLTFSWPIFDGWATKAKVEQAIIDLKETQLLKEKTVKDIALELKNAYLDLKNALAKIKAMQDEIEVYKDALSVIEKKYKAGIASSLDLDDVSLGYAVSLFNQKLADYDYILAKARFDKATGGM
jgi:outer membrane protein TolC